MSAPVAVGQVWTPRARPDIYSSVRVTAVDHAAVWTDRGRTTVFALRRDYRPIEPHAPGGPS